jgi:hypothetical protein
MDKSSRPEATIEISLGKLQQLFNSFDPSPFHDRDLDHDADEYSSAGLRKPRCSFRSRGHSFAAGPLRRSARSGAAIHNYFAYQQQQSRRPWLNVRPLRAPGRNAATILIGADLYPCNRHTRG